MKKLLVSLLAISTVVAFCACGASENNNTQTPDTQVVVEDTQAVVVDTQKEEVVEEADSSKVNYTVTVVDEEGNPIVGALVQLCNESCFPSPTGEDGVAKFSLEDAKYKVSFLTLPAGYTYSGEEQEFYFEEGSVDLVITLKPEA